MKELSMINLFLKVLLIYCCVVGCTTLVGSLLRLQDRELLIHPDKSGLAYPFKEEVCTDRMFAGMKWGEKCEDVQKIDFYDLNKKEVRNKLINAGFSCKSKMRFKY